MSTQPAQHGVHAVITSYNPSLSLVEAVTSATPQVRGVTVVDDGSSAGDASRVLEACRRAGASVLRHSSNQGIAQALNSGTDSLKVDPPDWVLFLDQDSATPAGYVAALVDAGVSASRAGVQVGMVAPESAASIVHWGSGGRKTLPNGVVLGGEPITSGLLVAWRTLVELGGHDAGLFIDGVDTDFWLRARSLGLNVVVAMSTLLEHRLGQGRTVRIGRRSIELTVARDFRYYYQARNLVVLVRRHGRQNPWWAVGAVVRQLRHLTLITALVPGRTSRLMETARGVGDGLRGREGRRPGQ